MDEQWKIAWAEKRLYRDPETRAADVARASSHLPPAPPAGELSDVDVNAMKAAFTARFDEDLPRTETLFAVARIGYRMALRDLAEGRIGGPYWKRRASQWVTTDGQG